MNGIQRTTRVGLKGLAWLTDVFGESESERHIIEEVVKGQTVGQLFNKLAEKYSRFNKKVFDTKSQKLSPQVMVIFNDRLLELLQGLETEIKDNGTIILIPAFFGG